MEALEPGSAVAMVGLGRMGLPMAGHVAKAGFAVVGHDVWPEARARAINEGLTVVDSTTELAAHRPAVVCSSLPDTAEVETAVGDLAPSLEPGAVWADLSTISVAGSRAVAQRLAADGIDFLDAPVSGTSIHAEAGTLVVMAGGPEAAFERARPVLAPFAARVERVGDHGAGLELKLITNRLLTTHLAAIAEAVLSLERTELSMGQALDLLRAGAVPRLLDYKAGPLIERDYRPQFTVDLMRKDLRLAAGDLPEPPLAAAAREIVEAASLAGHGDDDLAAIIEIIEARFRAR